MKTNFSGTKCIFFRTLPSLKDKYFLSFNNFTVVLFVGFPCRRILTVFSFSDRKEFGDEGEQSDVEEVEQQESVAATDIDTDQLSTADESPMSPEPEAAQKVVQASADDKALADDTVDDTAPSATLPVENGVSTSGDDENAKGDAASTHSDDSQDEDAREKVGVVEEVSVQSKPTTSTTVSAPKTGKRKGFACRCGEKTCRRFLFSFREWSIL